MSAASLIHLNKREALLYLTKLGYVIEDAQQAADTLHQLYQADVIITDGGNAVISCENGNIHEHPVTPLPQTNSTGAGDAHIATVLAYKAKGMSLDEAIAAANVISARVVTSDSSGQE